VSRDASGYWQASFVVEREPEQFPDTTGKIGVDWGVKDIAITSDPQYDLPCKLYRKRKQNKLAKIQKKMSRRRRHKGQPKSRGYEAVRVQHAKLHAQVARQRLHDARQWARNVVANNEFIAVEDFKPKFLAKSTMASKAADNAIGLHKEELIRYAKVAGRTVVLVHPAWTSQTCSECGARTKHRLTLKDRIFVCTGCGLIADRDRNAAKRILVQAETNLCSVEGVSHGDFRVFVLPELESPSL
jgi:putative transposase